jgi:predicted glycosyltransferase
MTLPELDILLYAHDGRGLGHISRTVAIGMALRRLYPDLRVLVVTGCSKTQELIHKAGLDWLKLPSYRTEVINGKSRGIDGTSGFTDKELGVMRANTLRNLVRQYRPRVVLADHTPQGKHRELLPALEATAGKNTQWVLGVRGVVGAVPQAGSDLSQQLFAGYYKKLLWYGDSRILSNAQLELLAGQYNTQPQECGYVARMRELSFLQNKPNIDTNTAGTIAVPWLGEHSSHVLTCIAGALKNIGPEQGSWQLFADLNPDQHGQIISNLRQLPHCRLQPPGPGYIEALLHSRVALIYGGYNSLTDVLAAGLPTVVLLRAMQDNEQQQHLRLLQQHTDNHLLSLEEQQITVKIIESALREQLRKSSFSPEINLQGAENAARILAEQSRK